MDLKKRTTLLSKTRGCVLGLVLGDALGGTGGGVPISGAVPATSAGQLVCFTVEGLIRFSVRGSHRGISGLPGVVWHTYHRWGALQGVKDIKRWRDREWPDGWLADLSILGHGRGTAPAIAAALQGGEMGTVKKPVGTSTDAYGLILGLPVGVMCLREPAWRGEFAADVAALTHGPEVIEAARLAATIVFQLTVEPEQTRDPAESPRPARRPESPVDIPAAVRAALEACAEQADSAAGQALEQALSAAASRPADPAELARLVPDDRAVSALAGGVYVASSLRDPHGIFDALLLAASVGQGGHAARVAGALLGTAFGADLLPANRIARLELAWVADTLARDLLTERLESPSGDEYDDGPDPHWYRRYPGW
ncbi:ADP-ribosylglycohydrolase family protein [Plantactinospora sonchi]|uniref:ADP-ribosylglycohydrolase family protein n=1 Tax=Plantactinospora sonchi TaxID=1544735 RepID=A0ABU7S2U8_9ACTN